MSLQRLANYALGDRCLFLHNAFIRITQPYAQNQDTPSQPNTAREYTGRRGKVTPREHFSAESGNRQQTQRSSGRKHTGASLEVLAMILRGTNWMPLTVQARCIPCTPEPSCLDIAMPSGHLGRHCGVVESSSCRSPCQHPLGRGPPKRCVACTQWVLEVARNGVLMCWDALKLAPCSLQSVSLAGNQQRGLCSGPTLCTTLYIRCTLMCSLHTIHEGNTRISLSSTTVAPHMPVLSCLYAA